MLVILMLGILVFISLQCQDFDIVNKLFYVNRIVHGDVFYLFQFLYLFKKKSSLDVD